MPKHLHTRQSTCLFLETCALCLGNDVQGSFLLAAEAAHEVQSPSKLSEGLTDFLSQGCPGQLSQGYQTWQGPSSVLLDATVLQTQGIISQAQLEKKQSLGILQGSTWPGDVSWSIQIQDSNKTAHFVFSMQYSFKTLS